MFEDVVRQQTQDLFELEVVVRGGSFVIEVNKNELLSGSA
jgi:hypothetical protein